MPFARVHNKSMEPLANTQIEIVYASARRLKAVRIDFEPTMQVIDAIRQSGLLEEFPEIDIAHNAVGIFGRKVSLKRQLKAGDRVEIYRPLTCSPQAARRQRALKSG